MRDDEPGARPGPLPLKELLRPVRPLRTTDTIAEAARRVSESGGGLPVVDEEDRLVGYLGERDLLGAICPGYLRDLHDTEFLTRDLSTLARWARDASETPVARHMTRDPASVEEDDSEMHAAELFLHSGLRSLPVVTRDRRVLGVVRLGDLIADLMGRVADGGG